MSIRVERLLKTYGSHAVVNHVSFEVAEGECFVLLGPSGSGKSTVLRIIAGLTHAEMGRVWLHDRDVSRLAPQQRGVGFVFQQYALFRHMTVRDNVEFALRLRKVPPPERRRRRDELLEIVGLVGFAGRYPHELSGGQQQRVALARALAHRPEVLLLDEPFGALDARIRAELRRSLRQIQRELAVTTIFVTHDQEEAFELADHLGVMSFGRLLEVGPPDELYQHPRTEFVAGFLGRANLLVGDCTENAVRLGEVRLPLATESDDTHGRRRRVQVLFRPEDVAVKDSAEALGSPLLGEAEVEETQLTGSFERLRLRIPRLDGVRPIAPAVPFGADHMLIDATRSRHLARRFPLRPGDRAWVGVRRVHALTHGGLRVLLLADAEPRAGVALEYGAALARLCFARVSLLVNGPREEAEARIRSAREMFGSDVAELDVRRVGPEDGDPLVAEAERRPCDLVVVGSALADATPVCEKLLSAGEHHVLIVPGPRPLPRRALICAAAGEPGKQDVQLAGRVLAHLGARATVLTVLDAAAEADARLRAERFLAAGLRTLSLRGVEAAGETREGAVVPTIAEELRAGGYDLLVLGTPPGKSRTRSSLGGVDTRLFESIEPVPVLLVRSGEE
ncbi:MAG: ATP-binding cassette domain-containing protein [Candidatus Eiseniibacteriota bacterium]